MKLLNFKSRFAARQRISSNIVTLFSLREERSLRKVLSSYVWKIISLATGKTKVSPRLRRFDKFLSLVFKNFKNHGAAFTIKWLKACHMTVQRKLSSCPCESLRDVEPNLPLPRLINGLPSFIGTMDRKMIREGHPGTIRLWLSILSIYRILSGPLSPKLNTITDKYNGDHDIIKRIIMVSKDVYNFNVKEKVIPSFISKNLASNDIHKSLSAGPNGPVAATQVITDAIAMAKYPEIYNPFVSYCKLTKSVIIEMLDHSINFSYDMIVNHGTDWIKRSSKISFDDIALGKLSFKEEAAGKLRIFAICDIWTQSLFKPLHDELFAFLKGLPNDGTFDQDASFARALEKAQVNNCGYSVDLSSATDRLPIDLQVGILDFMSGLPIGNLWKEILVLRPYMVRENKYIKDIDYVHYNTGQPMGCLSSWAMLAVTHHFILQTCAFHVYGTRRWFSNYEILGDDLVIFDKAIYLEYCRLMDLLNVGVNPSKSLVSEGVSAIEFAKRTGVNGKDVSGLSFKQFIAEDSVMGRMNLVLSASKRGLITSIPLILRLLARTKGDQLTSSPKGKEMLMTSLMGLLGYFVNNNKISLIDAVAFTVDPHDEEMENLDKPSLPFTMTLHEIFNLFKLETSVAPAKWEPSCISSFDDRKDIAKTEIVPFMADSMVREALSRSLLFANNYDSLLDEYAHSLINYEVGVSVFSKIELAQLRSFSEMFLLKNKDPQDLADEVYDFLLRARELPTMKEAVHFVEMTDNFISSLKFEPNSRVNKTAELSWMAKDISNAGKLTGTPYWRLLS